MVKGVSRLILVATVLACLTAGLFAEGKGETPGAASGPVTLRLMTPSAKQLKGVVAAFMQKYPQITIETEAVPGAWDNMTTKFLASFAGGSAPDLICVQDEPFPAFALRGVYYNLDPMIKADPDFKTDAYVTGALEAFRIDYKTGRYGVGHQLALPYNGGIDVGFYNKTLFAKAGAGAPQATWTWDQFLDTAKKLTAKAPDGRTIQYGYLPSSNWYKSLPSWIWSAGGVMLEYRANGEEYSGLDQPPVLTALTWLQNLHQKEGVSPVPDLAAAQKVNFPAGNVGMYADGSFYLGQVRQGAKDIGYDWDTFSWPPMNPSVGPSGQKTRSTFDGFAVVANTKHPKEAWQWLRFVCYGDGQPLLVQDTQEVDQPVLKSVLDSPVWKRPDIPQRMELFTDWAHGKAAIEDIMFPKMVGEMNKYYTLLVTGQATPKDTQASMHALFVDMIKQGDALKAQLIKDLASKGLQ